MIHTSFDYFRARANGYLLRYAARCPRVQRGSDEDHGMEVEKSWLVGQEMATRHSAVYVPRSPPHAFGLSAVGQQLFLLDRAFTHAWVKKPLSQLTGLDFDLHVLRRGFNYY